MNCAKHTTRKDAKKFENNVTTDNKSGIAQPSEQTFERQLKLRLLPDHHEQESFIEELTVPGMESSQALQHHPMHLLKERYQSLESFYRRLYPLSRKQSRPSPSDKEDVEYPVS